MLPDNAFVVVDAPFEAGVQNTGPAVSELTDGLAMGLVASSQLVVAGANTR